MAFFTIYKMMPDPRKPIGVFDSGVGGLTAANAIRQVLPNEDIIYFGDTFHLPYGDKSSDSVKYYSTRITEFLLQKECKIVLIACNTASSNAYQTVKKYAGHQAIVLNVIDPVVECVGKQPSISKVGVIGTKGTINSGAYENKLQQVNPSLKLASMATPLLVPMIEEGFIYDDISNAIIRNYLSKPVLKDIDSLILGCTHYPIIKHQISKYYDFSVQIIDSAQTVAARLREVLEEHELLNPQKEANQAFYVSDYTDYFRAIAKMFFDGEINLTKVNFWK
jgi:glutamate racemase